MPLCRPRGPLHSSSEAITMSISAELARGLAEQNRLPEIFAAVEPYWPNEGCGFVFQFGDELRVLPTANRAQMLHEKFPDQYPRGAEDWFEPDMKPWLRSVREGGEPRVIFHSHPEVGAYFSVSDREMARQPDENGEIVERNPGVRHVVVSVRQGKADGALMFAWNEETRDFDEVAAFDEKGQLVYAK